MTTGCRNRLSGRSRYPIDTMVRVQFHSSIRMQKNQTHLLPRFHVLLWHGSGESKKTSCAMQDVFLVSLSQFHLVEKSKVTLKRFCWPWLAPFVPGTIRRYHGTTFGGRSISLLLWKNAPVNNFSMNTCQSQQQAHVSVILEEMFEIPKHLFL